MDQSRFGRPQKLALDSATVLERVLQIQQGPNGLEAAMAFLEEQAKLQEQDRIAEIDWLESLRSSDDVEAQKIAAEVDSLTAAEAAVEASTASKTDQGSAEELATELEAHSNVTAPEPFASPSPGLRSDFEPVTASSAILASGPIPKVVRRPSAFANNSWLLLILAAAFLASLVGSSLIGEVSTNPGALPGLLGNYVVSSLAASAITCAGVWLGRRHGLSLGALLSAQYGVVAAVGLRFLFAAASVEVVWVTIGQLGYTITGAAGELFQGSANVVAFAQTGKLATISLALFVVVATLSALLRPRAQASIRILGFAILLILLIGATSQSATSLSSVFAGGSTGFTDPAIFGSYAAVLTALGFGFGVHVGSRLPEKVRFARFVSLLGTLLGLVPIFTACVLALVNPITTPKWLAVLDLVFLPVGAIAFISLALAGISAAAGPRGAGLLQWTSAAAVIGLAVLVDAQTSADPAIFAFTVAALCALVGQVSAGTILRRYGIHAASLASRRGIYGSVNVVSLFGLAVAIAVGVEARVSGLAVVYASALSLLTSALWSLSAGLLVSRRQDAELRAHQRNAISMFEEGGNL